MVMNLMGIPTDLPLYDQKGNLIESPVNDMNLMDFDGDLSEKESTAEEKQLADTLLSMVREQLAEVDDIGTDLTASDLVDVYDYNAEEGEREYYTVTIFGGKNGSGIWSNYLKTLYELVLRLEAKFDDVWIRKWNIDTVDDVFDVEIAILTYYSQLELSSED